MYSQSIQPGRLWQWPSLYRPNLLMIGALALGIPCAHASDAQPSQDPPFQHYIGYHGPDGHSVFPNCNPPIEWDGKTKKNILWETPLPSPRDGEPLVYGKKVFVMSEHGPSHDFPELLCLDADTGKILWRREINHLEIAIPDPAERAEVARQYHEFLVRFHELAALYYELNLATDDKVRANLQQQIAAKDAEMGKAKEHQKRFAQYDLGSGLESGGFKQRGFRFTAFPTPCTDGKAVYVFTGINQYACIDFDGNVKWLRWLPTRRFGTSSFRSPVICNGLFIADYGRFVRAFDTATGELRWEVDRVAQGFNVCEEHTCPRVFKVDDTDLLFSLGYDGLRDNANQPMIIRIADGTPLRVDGWRHSGVWTVVNADQPDTVFLHGGSGHAAWEDQSYSRHRPPAAVRFHLRGDVLKAEVLWSGIAGREAAHDVPPGFAYYDGKVYTYAGDYGNRSKLGNGHAILDAATGKVISGIRPDGRLEPAAPFSMYIYAIAGGRLYGMPESKGYGTSLEPAPGVIEVWDLEGKRLAVNTLYGPKIEGEVRRLLGASAMSHRFSYGNPFTVSGDRLYVRSYFYLHCIGEKK